MCIETIKNSKYHLIKISWSYYIALLSKSWNSLEIGSRLRKTAENRLKIFAISCANNWPNFILIPEFELVKQNRFAKISEGTKEKGLEQAKVFFGSTNHFMKNAKSFKFLQTNLVKFCEFKSFSFFV